MYGPTRDSSGPPPYFLKGCSGKFRYGFTEPIVATTFLPEHAVFVHAPGHDGLIEESLWHSRLFFCEWFRSDHSTRWQWRVNPEWGCTETIDGIINFCYHRMEFSYFHWFFDTLPRVWALKDQSPYGGEAKWYVGPLSAEFQVSSLALFGVSPEDCIRPKTSVVKFEQMVCPGFLFTEPLRTRPSFDRGVHHKGWSIDYISAIRDRAWHRYGCNESAGDLLLYVSRGDAAHRHLVNEGAVRCVLEPMGFTVVDPGLLPFEQQVQLFARARVIVGPHGAGLTNILWSSPGADLIELLPEGLADPGYHFLSSLCGHRHHAVLCETFTHAHGVAYADIGVDIELLTNVLREVL